jgi:hypothetical protein
MVVAITSNDWEGAVFCRSDSAIFADAKKLSTNNIAPTS